MTAYSLLISTNNRTIERIPQTQLKVVGFCSEASLFESQRRKGENDEQALNQRLHLGDLRTFQDGCDKDMEMLLSSNLDNMLTEAEVIIISCLELKIIDLQTCFISRSSTLTTGPKMECITFQKWGGPKISSPFSSFSHKTTFLLGPTISQKKPTGFFRETSPGFT